MASLDLNPADYKVWSVLQEQVYQAPIHDVNDFKRLLLDVCVSKFWQIKFKHSYRFIYWAKCYVVLDSYYSINSLTIWKVLEWYDQE